ncbi:hypothetical protein DFJ43DRAFT_78783 [Lentinula guzmanii]|uniref:Uncharacterized protein n=1 Tax=Lentinula guzmanii TaxID=2804957 RepID=A0AA38J2Q1_9AGAR|nr:hypothetical protein DFJ43DRAFT_78783 [Lentinula guzmanii]
MSPLPLKIFLISLICILALNVVGVNTAPQAVTRLQKTQNLQAIRGHRLIGYLLFLDKKDTLPYEDGKFPHYTVNWFPSAIYSHPTSNTRFHVCKVFDTRNLVEGIKVCGYARYYGTVVDPNTGNTQMSPWETVAITPVLSSHKHELRMFVPMTMMSLRPPTVDCDIGKDEETPVANWLDLGLNLPEEYKMEVRNHG